MTKRHVDIVLAPEEAKRKLSQMTRRGFIVGGVAAAAGFAGYEFLTKTGQIGDVPWPQRAVLNFNGDLAHAYLSHGNQMPTFSANEIGHLKANGDLGLDDDDEIATWRLHFEPGANVSTLTLGLPDVQSLPHVDMITNFCCIEGWNTIAQWKGVRLADFLNKFLPAGQPRARYVYMSTPDEEYYVGLDMKSATHPQTLLAWELNGQPLTPDHGAPLRLVIPVKYGIKNIKRIGLIRLTNERPADYWAENGYDWFAGL